MHPDLKLATDRVTAPSHGCVMAIRVRTSATARVPMPG